MLKTSFGLIPVVTCVVLWLAVLLTALHRGWLARFRYGFMMALLAGLLSLAAVGPSLISVWSYEAAKRIITQQIQQHLSDTGQIIESDLTRTSQTALGDLRNAAQAISPDFRGEVTDTMRDVLENLRTLNPFFLHAHVLDQKGRIVESLGPVPLQDAVPHTDTVLAGEFQKGPFYSPALDRTVLQLGVPLLAPDGRITGSLVAQFDMESSIRRRYSSTRFGKSGFVMIADSRGRIIAHPDESRHRESVADYTWAKNALNGNDGFLLETDAMGDSRFYFYRSLRNPATTDCEPMALMTEMSEEEAYGSVRSFLHRFLVVLAIMMLAAVLVVTQVVTYARRPLYELLNVVNRVRAGDLTARIRRPSHDEIGQLGESLNHMVAGLQERDRIKDVFGRYVTTQVSERILRQELTLGGEARVVTVLFSDIRDFTTMSELMTPAEVVSFLNEYFSAMVDVVFEFCGVLDKYIGDGLMAVYGSLDNSADHADRAVRTAVRMVSKLAELNQKRAAAGKPAIRVGIGIHTDTVIIGNIGSRKRLEYTAVGDGVNTASRLEGLNKEFGTTIIISGTTYEAVRDICECRPLPDAHLKGKHRSVACYEVLDLKTSLTTVTPEAALSAVATASV